MSANKKSLGRGLDSLLPHNFDNSLLMAADERVQKRLISDIRPNPQQPRREFDEVSLQELSVSIKKHGVLQPIIVSPEGENNFVIIAGERRWRASKLAGLETIPVIVRAPAELEQLEIALIENVQRVDLSPLEQALSIQRLHDQFNLSYQEIASKLGKAATTINNIVRLLQLPKAATEALQSGKISEGHARAILALKDTPEKQRQLLDHIMNESWSVRQAEQFATAQKQGLKSNRAVSHRVSNETPESKSLAQHLGVKVTVQHTARGGRLQLHFKNDTELNQLYKKLGS